MDKQDRLDFLYKKYLNNTATADELQWLFQEMGSHTEAEWKDRIIQELEKTEVAVTADDNRLSAVFAKLEDQIAEEPKTISLWRFPAWTKVAAVVTVILGLGLLVRSYLVSEPEVIVPGGFHAALQLKANEEPLDLTQTTLKKNIGGIQVTTTANGTITYTRKFDDTTGIQTLNVLQTPAGGMYKVTLSDGSEVMLNSKSSLEFPVGFHGPNRRVKLKGEAYFQVAKNKEKPFIVEMEQGNVQVLGTSFTVNTFDDQSATTLFEGSVRLTSPEQVQLLSPGERGIIQRGIITVAQADTAAARGWTKGLFVFNNAPLGEVLVQLSRWYNISVDYASLPDRRLHMRLNMDTPFEEVLQMLSVTTRLKFKMEERRLSVVNP
jgi:ferric-dicitrate binding protein FerR (iron transport regulator)